ncbi:hypothetical protein Tco_0033614 [Tanacetum coccineum]
MRVRPDLEDPPHVPPDDGQTMLASPSALEVYGRSIAKGVFVQDNLMMDVLSSLMDSDDESVTMASKPKPVIPLGNAVDGSSGVTTDMTLPPRDQRHEWLRFDTQGYTEEEKQEFATRLAKIYYRKILRVQVLDFARLSEINEGDGDLDMTERLRVQQRVMMERMMSEHARYSAWMVDRMTELMESRGMRYQRFDGSNAPDTHLQFERHRVRQRTDGAGTSTQQTQSQPQHDA